MTPQEQRESYCTLMKLLTEARKISGQLRMSSDHMALTTNIIAAQCIVLYLGDEAHK